MRRIFTTLFLLCISISAWAEDGLVLQHEVVGMEQVASGTRITYKLVVFNNSSTTFHSLHLTLEDISLSLLPGDTQVDFQTLPPYSGKQRFLTVTSAQHPGDVLSPNLLLLHLRAYDELGSVVTHLLRSTELRP